MKQENFFFLSFTHEINLKLELTTKNLFLID